MRYAVRNAALVGLALLCGAWNCSKDPDCPQKVTIAIQTGSGPTPTPETARAICAADARGDTREAVRLVNLVRAGVGVVGAAAATSAVLSSTWREGDAEPCPTCGGAEVRVQSVFTRPQPGGATIDYRTCANCSTFIRQDSYTPAGTPPRVSTEMAGALERLKAGR